MAIAKILSRLKGSSMMLPLPSGAYWCSLETDTLSGPTPLPSQSVGNQKVNKLPCDININSINTKKFKRL